jgi:hypothetical protein
MVADHELRGRIGSDRMQKTGLLALFVNRDVPLESRGRLADYVPRDGAHNPGVDASGGVAESGIELRQCIGCIFLIVGGKILAIAAP